jgi:hypothetical protein
MIGVGYHASVVLCYICTHLKNPSERKEMWNKQIDARALKDGKQTSSFDAVDRVGAPLQRRMARSLARHT